jgi:hypothetical protein
MSEVYVSTAPDMTAKVSLRNAPSATSHINLIYVQSLVS